MVKAKHSKSGFSKNEEILIENFTNLQTVFTHLAFKFDKLSEEISKLLQLFEISAKEFMKYSSKTSPAQNPLQQKKDLELMGKLDNLLEQNRIIAKGLTLIEEKISSRDQTETISTKSKPLPKL